MQVFPEKPFAGNQIEFPAVKQLLELQIKRSENSQVIGDRATLAVPDDVKLAAPYWLWLQKWGSGFRQKRPW